MKQADVAPDGVPDAVIVAGPTCSGKSALAVVLALHFDGVVINADSMQVYRELRVLTARPTLAEEAACPHALYGIRAAAEPGSVAWWRGEAIRAMQQAWEAGRLPILCGGTGMYLAALTDGLTDIPDSGEDARRSARGLLEEIGPAALHARLRAADPETAEGLRANDGQRLARAWEVLAGTGRGLADWRRGARLPPVAARFIAIRLQPPRDLLRQAIGRRFEAMLAAGGLDEVAALLALGLPRSLPAMRAHGVPELAAHLAGEISREEACARAILSQSQYTKRQATWFGHHPLAEPARTDIITTRIADMTQDIERNNNQIIAFIQSRVDAGGSSRS